MLATCNRVEVYAEVSTFHGGLADLGDALAATTGVDLAELKDHLYVHYADRAVEHLFSVACGLDSMAVGESQVLGPAAPGAARRAGRRRHRPGARRAGAAGAARRQARARRDRASTAPEPRSSRPGIHRAERSLGPVSERAVLVVGAGSMSALAATTLHRWGAGSITIANRTAEHAERLAAAVGGRAAALDDLADELARADLVVSCTGAVGTSSTSTLAGGAPSPGAAASKQVYVDLALPRDVDPDGRPLPGVEVAGPRRAGRRAGGHRADVRHRPGARPRRRGGRRLPHRRARAGRRPDRRRAARSRRRRRRRRAGAARPPPARTSTPPSATSCSAPCTGSSRSSCTRRRCG